MGLYIYRCLLVDRIHITIKIIGDEIYSAILEILQEGGIEDIAADLVPNGKIKIKSYPGKGFTKLDYYPAKDKIAEIHVGTTKTKSRYFKLVLYPSKFKLGEFDGLKYMLASVFPGFEYETLFKAGRVTYLELSADNYSKKAHSFIPFCKRCTASLIWNDKGEKGTTYTGSPTGSSYFRTYDKHRQLLKKKKTPAHQMHTRIESVSRHLGISPASLLSDMSNPFLKLEIADLQAARNLTNDEVWQKFLDDCLERGSPKALSSLSKKQRKLYMEMLRKTKAGWWSPTNVWADFPKALEKIHP